MPPRLIRFSRNTFSLARSTNHHKSQNILDTKIYALLSLSFRSRARLLITSSTRPWQLATSARLKRASDTVPSNLDAFATCSSRSVAKCWVWSRLSRRLQPHVSRMQLEASPPLTGFGDNFRRRIDVASARNFYIPWHRVEEAKRTCKTTINVRNGGLRNMAKKRRCCNSLLLISLQLMRQSLYSF